MWRELFYIIQSKPVTKEFINCCLSYTLAQPVDIDINIVVCLMLQYLGINQLSYLLDRMKIYIATIKPQIEKKMMIWS